MTGDPLTMRYRPPGNIGPSVFLLVFVAVLSPFAGAQETPGTAPLQISDVPRGTQLGSGVAPAGAPGNGRYLPPVPANPDLPTLWLIGDSTVRNGTVGDNGPNGQWGWGAPLTAFFDLKKINVVNRAFGGTSSRSFYNGFFWRNLKSLIRKGDFVVMQFGHNDTGKIEGEYPDGRASIKGIGEETQDVTHADGAKEVVHTYGWYLKQYVAETRAQGGTPIICSLTPRKRWDTDGKFLRDNKTYVVWAAQVAKETDTPFVPLYDIIGRKYQTLGAAKVDTFYVPSPRESLHTGWDGAVANAECVVSGLKALPGDPLEKFFSARASGVAPASDITVK